MGLTIIATGGQSYVAQVRCDDCSAEAPKVERPERLLARIRAVRSAEDQGFISYQNGRTWVCPACRIRRIPDDEKPRFPNLCARYGISLPAPQNKPAENNDYAQTENNDPPPAENGDCPRHENQSRPRTKKRKRKGD